jgi:hypothetical protein
MVVLGVRALRVQAQQSRPVLEDGHRWNRLGAILAYQGIQRKDYETD